MKCDRHPKYTAKRKPKVECQPCIDMYIASLLEKLLQELKLQTVLMKKIRREGDKDSAAYRKSQTAYRKSLKS